MAKILAIESSCDETAASVIDNGRLLSNIVSTQIEVHRKYGGVMPEIASRLHAENISIVIKEAMEAAHTKFEELDAYLCTLEQDLDSIDIAIRTGNVGLDAILSSKVSIARKNTIEVSCTAKVPSDLKIPDVHLCAIVGNLMDNAIEACEKITSSQKQCDDVLPKFIRIYIGLFKNQLYISVTNSTTERKRKKLSELVTGKTGEHGFGLRRIDKITEKYDGFVNRKNEPGIFATEVMLPV